MTISRTAQVAALLKDLGSPCWSAWTSTTFVSIAELPGDPEQREAKLINSEAMAWHAIRRRT